MLLMPRLNPNQPPAQFPHPGQEEEWGIAVNMTLAVQEKLLRKTFTDHYNELGKKAVAYTTRYPLPTQTHDARDLLHHAYAELYATYVTRGNLIGNLKGVSTVTDQYRALALSAIQRKIINASSGRERRKRADFTTARTNDDEREVLESLMQGNEQLTANIINRDYLVGLFKAAGLCEEEKYIVWKHIVEGMKFAEIGTLLNKREGTIRKRFHTLKKKVIEAAAIINW